MSTGLLAVPYGVQYGIPYGIPYGVQYGVQYANQCAIQYRISAWFCMRNSGQECTWERRKERL